MEVYVSLDKIQYKAKPLQEIPKIKRRAAEGWVKIGVAELAELVGDRGCAIVPGHMQGGMKAENCTEMQLLVLDFDGGISFLEVQERCRQLWMPITFAYHTFSSTGQNEKFRVVFAYEQLLADPFAIKVILAMLHRIFPKCDHACKNLDRLFLGGKELIYLDEGACISLAQILTPFYQSLDTGENFKRNVMSFCRKQGVLIVDGMPAIREVGQLEWMTEAKDFAIVHEVGMLGKSAFFILEDKGGAKGGQVTTYKEKTRRLDIAGASVCQLLDDFNKGRPMDHNARFAICTNLLHIDGGKKHFMETLKRDYSTETYEKWEASLQYMKRYHSHNCSEDFCPYYGKCDSAGNIVETLAMDRRVWREEEEVYYSLDEARECLEKNLDEAFGSSWDGIHLIKAQTGLGKTSSYIKLIEGHPDEKFLVALPTNRLKEQVARDISAKLGRDVFMTASIHGNLLIPQDVQDEVSRAHGQGFHNKTGEFIQKYYETIKDDPYRKGVGEECKKILEGVKGMKGERVVVTTHAYLMNLPGEFMKQYTVIIDEDILVLQAMNRMATISKGCLEELLKLGNPEYAKIAAEMLGAPEGRYGKITGSTCAAAFSKENLEGVGMSENDNVNDIAMAGAFVRKGDEVVYFCPQKFQKMKYIILSATLNGNIYKAYFKGHMETHLYMEKKARYKGRLEQFPFHSLGRYDLEKKKDMVMNFMREIAKGSRPDVITFKSKEDVQRFFGKESEFHFGNTCGINSMSGHDIVIVGTPYKVEEAYKLVACYLGADVNREADKRPRPRRVKYKGNSFLAVTYDEPLLQELQLYSLESELEQCVGRARLLRNECTVYVLSSFPCEQAELHMKDYLK